jgi:hypothetical protein
MRIVAEVLLRTVERGDETADLDIFDVPAMAHGKSIYTF